MKKALETILAFLGIGLFSLFIAYALVYAWDFEADLQEVKDYLEGKDDNAK